MTIQKDLLASCWTWAGDVGPGSPDERSPVPLAARIAAVASAGWEGVGLSHADVVEYRDTIGLGTVKRMLDRARIRRVELEFLTDWWQTDERRRVADRMRDDLFAEAGELGATVIKVGAINSTGEPAPDLSQLAAGYHELAEAARSYGLDVALEALGGHHVSSLAQSIELVRAADHPNGGLVADVYHCARAREDDWTQLPRLLAGVPVMIVELGDARLLADGSVGPRCLPGEGDLDVSGFVAGIWRAGWRGYWGIEIIADDLRSLPVETGVDVVRRGALRILERADQLVAG